MATAIGLLTVAQQLSENGEPGGDGVSTQLSKVYLLIDFVSYTHTHTHARTHAHIHTHTHVTETTHRPDFSWTQTELRPNVRRCCGLFSAAASFSY